MKRRLKIAIITTGRFHVCDLARELSSLGHDVKFYSWVPPWRTKKFGLPAKCNRWMLPRIGFRAVRARISRGSENQQLHTEQLVVAYDKAVAKSLEPCDVMIGMSGMCNEVGRVAKNVYGAHLWIERGSRHILSQREILAKITGANQVSEFSVQRELADYEQADVVSVLARHCEGSFLEQGFDGGKLVCNPLGVDLTDFPQTPTPTCQPTIIMVGNWSLQKGCNILVDAWRQLDGVRLLHVGPVSDCPLPTDPNFVHVDKVDQSVLIGYYSQAHVMALASHQEGLATVQPQALSCGLRLVCTTHTGGADLSRFVSAPNAIRVVPPNDSSVLADELRRALDDCASDSTSRIRMDSSQREELSWTGYARRYSEMLLDRVHIK